MHVLLVHPRSPKTFWSFDAALALVGRRALLPPLGLITVAALLPPHWHLRLVDTQIREVSEEEWHWADLVIFSAMIVHKRDLARQIALARRQGLPVAVGGPFATSTPGAAELVAADYLILGEGEISIPPFVEAIEAGCSCGVFSADGAKPDVRTSPVPRFDLLELDAYEMMAVQFSRGCPFQCEFCDIIVLYGRTPRTKTPPQLLAELETLHHLGWRGDVFLVDDNFIGNRRNVRLLLPALLEWQRRHDFPFAFTTEASIDLAADEALMTAMTACRFRRVFLGIETPDECSLAGAGKHQNMRSPLEESVRTIRAHGLQVMAGFILGFDGESPGAGERIVEFVTRTGIPLAMVGVLQALPGTALWLRLQREGRLLEADDRFDQGVQTHLLNFVPTRPIEDIGAEFVAAFRQLYEPLAYLERAYRTCCALGAPRWRRYRRPLAFLRRRPRWRLARLRGLLILCWRQGVRRPTRKRFWPYLAAIGLRRPALLADFLWMLLLEEHFLEYAAVVQQQVREQLAIVGVHPRLKGHPCSCRARPAAPSRLPGKVASILPRGPGP